MNNYKFTVFTPTFNRANLINRVFDSLSRQTLDSFEWLIIDDGSTDNTEELIKNYSSKANFPIRYVKQLNQGKVAAINNALELAEGFFFLVFDSDDWCTDDALEKFYLEWKAIPDAEKHSYAALSCLKAYVNGNVVGEDYKRQPKRGSTYLDRFNKRIRGDKWECIITGIHKKHKYDLVPGDRYMAPEYAWLSIGKKYNTLFIDETLSIVEYQADGISQNNIKHRVNNSRSTIVFYKLAMKVSKGFINKSKVKVNLGRFYLHQSKYIESISSSSFLFPLALVLYNYDLKKLKK